MHLSPISLVENIAKKNRSRFFHCGSFDQPNLQPFNDYIFVFLVYQLIFKDNEAFNILLERSWKYLSNGVLHAPKISKFQSQKKKEKSAIV